MSSDIFLSENSFLFIFRFKTSQKRDLKYNFNLLLWDAFWCFFLSFHFCTDKFLGILFTPYFFHFVESRDEKRTRLKYLFSFEFVFLMLLQKITSVLCLTIATLNLNVSLGIENLDFLAVQTYMAIDKFTSVPDQIPRLHNLSVNTQQAVLQQYLPIRCFIRMPNYFNKRENKTYKFRF